MISALDSGVGFSSGNSPPSLGLTELGEGVGFFGVVDRAGRRK